MELSEDLWESLQRTRFVFDEFAHANTCYALFQCISTVQYLTSGLHGLSIDLILGKPTFFVTMVNLI